MKKGLYIGLALLGLSACGPKDKQFCECLDISAKQNEAAEKLSNKDQSEISEKEAQAFIQLKVEKDSICAAYEMKSGDELMKLRTSCGVKSDLQ